MLSAKEVIEKAAEAVGHPAVYVTVPALDYLSVPAYEEARVRNLYVEVSLGDVPSVRVETCQGPYVEIYTECPREKAADTLVVLMEAVWSLQGRRS